VAIEKAGEDVFRCGRVGSAVDRWQEMLAWFTCPDGLHYMVESGKTGQNLRKSSRTTVPVALIQINAPRQVSDQFFSRVE